MGAHKNRYVRSLIVDLSVRFGGASVRAIGLLQAFPSGQAALATLDNSPVAVEATARDLEVYPVGRHKADPRIAARISRLVRTGGFQVLDSQNTQSKFWSTVAAQRTGAALVSTLNSWYESEHGGRPKGLVYQTIERLTTRFTDMFIAVSTDINRRLLNQGVPDNAVAMIPNAVKIDPGGIDVDGKWLRATYRLPPGARVCCAVGRLVEAKGYAHLIRGIAGINDKDQHCLIVGGGRLHSELTALILRLGERERIHLLGFRDRMEALKIIKAADIFLMPSVTEGTPIALLEAAALSRPIVASRVGGIPDIVSHGKHALLVQPGNELEIADAIQKLYAQPDLARDLGKRAHDHIIENYSVNTQAGFTQRAYELALTRSRQRLARI